MDWMELSNFEVQNNHLKCLFREKTPTHKPNWWQTEIAKTSSREVNSMWLENGQRSVQKTEMWSTYEGKNVKQQSLGWEFFWLLECLLCTMGNCQKNPLLFFFFFSFLLFPFSSSFSFSFSDSFTLFSFFSFSFSLYLFLVQCQGCSLK